MTRFEIEQFLVLLNMCSCFFMVGMIFARNLYLKNKCDRLEKSNARLRKSIKERNKKEYEELNSRQSI